MLVLQSQKNNGEPEWIEVTHKGETMRICSGKRKTLMPGYRDASVSIFFDAGKEWAVKRTGEYLKRGGNGSNNNNN